MKYRAASVQIKLDGGAEFTVTDAVIETNKVFDDLCTSASTHHILRQPIRLSLEANVVSVNNRNIPEDVIKRLNSIDLSNIGTNGAYEE